MAFVSQVSTILIGKQQLRRLNWFDLTTHTHTQKKSERKNKQTKKNAKKMQKQQHHPYVQQQQSIIIIFLPALFCFSPPNCTWRYKHTIMKEAISDNCQLRAVLDDKRNLFKEE